MSDALRQAEELLADGQTILLALQAGYGIEPEVFDQWLASKSREMFVILLDLVRGEHGQ